LSYYNQKPGKEARADAAAASGSVRLDALGAVTRIDARSFHIQTERRSFLLRCRDENVCGRWITALQEALRATLRFRLNMTLCREAQKQRRRGSRSRGADAAAWVDDAPPRVVSREKLPCEAEDRRKSQRRKRPRHKRSRVGDPRKDRRVTPPTEWIGRSTESDGNSDGPLRGGGRRPRPRDTGDYKGDPRDRNNQALRPGKESGEEEGDGGESVSSEEDVDAMVHPQSLLRDAIIRESVSGAGQGRPPEPVHVDLQETQVIAPPADFTKHTLGASPRRARVGLRRSALLALRWTALMGLV
jgi:hypothetical protein